jgi:iodotyrosine deiodinase
MSTVPLSFVELPETEMRQRAEAFHAKMSRRRSVREFASRAVPREVIADCLRTAGAAPSGANLQPWHFAVLGDLVVKRRLREAAEAEERVYYAGRSPDTSPGLSVPDGAPVRKWYLEAAPWVIAVFARTNLTDPDGSPRRACFLQESVGIACGFLLVALHEAGLATFVHAPSPTTSLNEICDRPVTEVPYLLILAGYPATGARVPAHAAQKLPFESIVSWR